MVVFGSPADGVFFWGECPVGRQSASASAITSRIESVWVKGVGGWSHDLFDRDVGLSEEAAVVPMAEMECPFSISVEIDCLVSDFFGLGDFLGDVSSP